MMDQTCRWGYGGASQRSIACARSCALSLSLSLRAMSSAGPVNRSAQFFPSTRQDDEIMKTGPMRYKPTDFLATSHIHHAEEAEPAPMALDPPTTTKTNANNLSSPSLNPNNPLITYHSLSAPVTSSQGSFAPSAHRTSISPLTGKRLLSSGATWDYIQAHPLFKEGLVDIADVTEKLKGESECDGTGPAFEQKRLDRAIRESAALRKDELI